MRLRNYVTITVAILIAIGAAGIAKAQSTFTGKVLDQKTEKVITNAHVRWVETGKVTATNEEGIFSFEVEEEELLTLSISYVGYQTQTVKIGSGQVSAETKAIYLTRKTQALTPVTVLARKEQGQPGQSLNAMTTVNPSHDAGSFLKDSPNVSGIRKAGSYGVDPVVRGFQKNQLMVQLDGVLQSQGACPNRMDPPTSHIQLEQVEEVEILKGPYALKHGPSFGGVINFKSEHPDFYGAPTLSSYFTVGYESNIDRQRYAGGIKKNGGKWTTNIFGSFASTENYKDGSGTAVRSGFSNAEYTVNTSVQLNAANSLSARISQNFARDVDYPALMMDMREDNVTNVTLTYRNTDLGNGRFESSAFGSYVEHIMDNQDRQMSNMVDAVTDATTETYGYDMSYVLPAAVGNWTFGTQATLRSMEGFRTRDFKMGPMAGNTVEDNVWQGGKRNRWGGVVEFQPNIANWDFVISSRLDYYYSNATDPDAYFEQNIGDLDNQYLGWSASAGFSKDLSAGWSTGFWLGRSERYPGMDELYINYLPVGMDPYEYVGNPQLDTEVNYQADAMINYSNDVISIEGSLFYSYVVDYISAAIRSNLQPKQNGVPGVKQFINVDEAALYGFEWTLQNNNRSRLGYKLSTAYTIGRNLTAHEDLPQIPAYEANLKLDYQFLNGKLVPQLHVRGVAEQTRVAEDFDEQPTDGYILTDFKLTSRLFKSVRLSAGVNNLFDVTYHEHLNRSLQGSTLPINDLGRSVFVELKWNGILSRL
jgi:iron complex outermembrane receptor protein